LYSSFLLLSVVSVDIVKGRIKKPDSKDFYIDTETKNSSSYKTLLNFIVNCIAWFIKDRNIRKRLPIGFTFPFPVKQESLICGKLIRWTKDFKAPGAEGKDVVQLLKEAASKREEVSIQRTTATFNSLGMISLLHAIGCYGSQCCCINQRHNRDPPFCGK
jgi:hexokinase